jgi:hypothetical protein
VQNKKAKPNWDKAFDREYYINMFRERNNLIIQYFYDRPDDLLVIDLTKEKNTAAILRFLNIPDEYAFDMPHLNRSN